MRKSVGFSPLKAIKKLLGIIVWLVIIGTVFDSCFGNADSNSATESETNATTEAKVEDEYADLEYRKLIQDKLSGYSLCYEGSTTTAYYRTFYLVNFSSNTVTSYTRQISRSTKKVSEFAVESTRISGSEELGWSYNSKSFRYLDEYQTIGSVEYKIGAFNERGELLDTYHLVSTENILDSLKEVLDRVDAKEAYKMLTPDL